MTIEDIILLLSNRLKEFQLSRDYAKMLGDLEKMNAADKEIIGLEDTLFKLNLLVETSKSAAVKEEILAEVMSDGSVAVLGDYDISPYATDPLHEEKIMNILSGMGVMDTVEKIDSYIQGKYSSPVTGEMIINAAKAYTVDTRLMMAIMEQDSRFGTVGLAVSTTNPGNVGNDDDGNIRTYDSWQDGVTAVAEWLSRHRGSTPIPEAPLETILEPIAISTFPIITPTATTTISTTTSTTTTSTTTPATSIPVEEPVPVVTSTSTTTPSTTTSTTTPATSIPVEEPVPVVTSTSTTTPSTTTSTSSPQATTAE